MTNEMPMGFLSPLDYAFLLTIEHFKMDLMKYAILLCTFVCLVACGGRKEKEDHQLLMVKKATTPPTLDGKATENC
ncbi:MAG: hypothetical protein HKP53_04180, partial [Eudoraea sp.]|nr:hypothetical protein [Eudoraea sp.]